MIVCKKTITIELMKNDQSCRLPQGGRILYMPAAGRTGDL
jgi:hypothetical protein